MHSGIQEGGNVKVQDEFHREMEITFIGDYQNNNFTI